MPPTVNIHDRQKYVIISALSLISALLAAYGPGHLPVPVMVASVGLIAAVLGLLKAPREQVPADPSDLTKPATLVVVPSIPPPPVPAVAEDAAKVGWTNIDGP